VTAGEKVKKSLGCRRGEEKEPGNKSVGERQEYWEKGNTEPGMRNLRVGWESAKRTQGRGPKLMFMETKEKT